MNIVKHPDMHEKLNVVKSKKIIFGHQSVGYNIVKGLDRIVNETGVTGFNLVESKNTMNSKGGIFAHCKIGRNQAPKEKISDFATLIEANHDSVDIAMMKLCYADIQADTDIEDLFMTYTQKMDSLEIKYPDIQFIHFTVPVKVKEPFIKRTLKKILGKDQSVKRFAYNELVRNKYAGKNLFDLALLETGDTLNMRSSEKKWLHKEYTDDGAHLNEAGSGWIAANLIRFIAGNQVEK